MARINPPKQKRSREVFERVLAAADRMVRERPFTDVTVGDLCVEADVSMSSLYARFPTKGDILTTLFERHVDVARDAAAKTVAEALDAGADIGLVTHVVLKDFLAFVRQHGQLMTSIFEMNSLNEQYWRLSSEVVDSMVDLAAEVYGRRDVEMRRVLHLGCRIASSSIQRAVGVPMSFGERIGVTDDELVEELADMLVAYWDRFVETHPASVEE